jgi:hypothetical protein
MLMCMRIRGRRRGLTGDAEAASVSFMKITCLSLLFIATLISWTACSPPATEEASESAPPMQAPPSEPKTIDLFASKNLGDWNHVLKDSTAKKEEVWSFNEEGHLVCTGQPIGFLASKQTYQNFKIDFSWRWPAFPKNSGFFIRIQDEKPIPKSIEIQLQHGSAGAIMGLGGVKIEGEGVEVFEHDTIGTIHKLKRQAGRENRPKEWNTMSVHVEDGNIQVVLNGVEANACTGADMTPGPIGFQSEGGLIEFKDVRFTPLD